MQFGLSDKTKPQKQPERSSGLQDLVVLAGAPLVATAGIALYVSGLAASAAVDGLQKAYEKTQKYLPNYFKR